MKSEAFLGVIGGSGLYSMPDLLNAKQFDLDTPYGKPSAPIVVGELEGQRVAFLARHGIGHHIIPGQVNYRANIYALKNLGIQRIISISACGSLREDFSPGEIIIPDQVFDLTRHRKQSFFGDGLVAHVSVADPFCADLSNQLEKATSAAGGVVHRGGNMITIEGPRFSTRAESNVFRTWGMSIIGMTTSPEVFLAREAELCYAVMAHVTDYDVWHISEDPVTVEMVIEVLHKNSQLAQGAVRNLVKDLSEDRNCTCKQALASALITAPEVVPPETRENLHWLVGKYLH